MKMIPKSFHTVFLERRMAGEYYSKIMNRLTGTLVHRDIATQERGDDTKIHILYDVPSYLEFEVNYRDRGYKLNKLKTYKGSMIVLKDYRSIDDYL